MAQRFDVQEAPVGGKADLPQGGQIAKRRTNLEIVGVVDGGFGPKRLSVFVVLLDLGLFVLHVKRGDDALGEHAATKPARGAAGDSAIEDQLHLIGPPKVEIPANHLFEETLAGQRPIEDLNQRELGLQDREMVPIPSLAMRRGEGMRNSTEPLAEDRVDLGRVKGVGNSLHAGGASLERMPLSSGSNGTSRCVSCRFNHSCPFRQSFAG